MTTKTINDLTRSTTPGLSAKIHPGVPITLEMLEAMSKKQAQAKKNAKSRKKQSNRTTKAAPKKETGVPMKDKSQAQDELDATRKAQTNRAGGSEARRDDLREDVREALDKQGPGTVHNAPEERTDDTSTEGAKSPDQIAHEARERGETIKTTIDPAEQDKVVDKTEEDEKKDGE